MKRFTNLLLGLILLCLPLKQGVAQAEVKAGSPFIQNYHPRQYAEISVSPQNWAIIRDDRGILYVGNTEGIMEYDGNNWRMIHTSNKSIVRSLAKDSAGRVYAGGSGDFGYLATDKKGKKHYKSLLDKIPEEEQNFNDIWECAAINGKVYFVSNNKVFIYQQDTVNILHADEPVNGFQVNDAMYFTKGQGLYKIENNQFSMLPGTGGYNYTFTMPFRKNSILALTEDNRWFTYDLDQAENEEMPAPTPNRDSLLRLTDLPLQAAMQNAQPYTGLKISNTKFAIGTYRNGIFIFNHRGEMTQRISQDYGLLSDAIYTFYIDGNNHLWAGLESGFANIDYESPLTIFSQAHGIDGTPISLLKARDNLYAGTTHGIFTNAGRNTNTLQKIPGLNTTVWEFGQANQELLAASSAGLFHITPEHELNELHSVNIASHSFSGRFFNTIFLGLWDGFVALKLDFPQQKNGEISVTDTLDFPEITTSIRKITEDGEGNLWLSTDYNGLIKLNFQSNSLQDYEIIRFKKQSGLPGLDNNRVYNLDNSIYVTTRKGIYVPQKSRATAADSTIQFVGEPNFGPIFNRDSMPVLQVLDNPAGEKFVFVEAQGFGKVFEENGEWKWETKPFKKIPSRAIYRYYIDRSNIIWAIGSENIYRYNPEISKDYEVPFNTLIRKVSADDSLLFYGSTSGNQSVAYGELTHKQNAVTFEFSAPFFDREKEIEYQYRLKGFEEKWSDWTQSNIKEYTNLAPGDYMFEVKGRNIFGITGKKAVYRVTVYPAWYNTIYAYMGYALIAIVLFYLAVVLYGRRLKSMNQRLEQMVNERTERMRQQKEEISKQNEEILKQNSEISKQKNEIQKQTRELERKNADLQNLSIVARETDNAIMITDAEGNFEWVNKGFTNIFGITFNELLKKSKNIVGPDTPEHVKEKINHAITNKETIYYEFSTQTPNGKEVYVQATLTPIVNEYGKIVKLVAVDADITRIKKAEEEINKQKEQLKEQRDSYKKQKNKVERAYKNIKLLSDFGQKITSTLDLDAINNMIYDYVNDLMDIDAFGIGEYVEQNKTVEFKGFMEKGIPVPFFSFKFGQDNSLVVWSLKNKQDLLINDLENEYKEYVSEKPAYETQNQPKSVIIIPLVVESKAIGVVTAQSYQKDAFSFNDLSIIKSLASYIAIALENTRVYELIKSKNQHINSSIRYAKKLQQAVLPPKSEIDKVFDNFLIYRAKEVVSGDFYWIRKVQQPNAEAAFHFVAVVDCTGHGVPGAFMSIIGNRVLNEIIDSQIYEPDSILYEMNKRIIDVLNQDENENNDGMDVALAKFERVHDNKVIVTFAGAKRPLYYYSAKQQKLETLKGDRKAIGGVRAINKNQQYNSHELLLSSEDTVYLLSDGIIDQHGPDRKRFGTPRLSELLEQSAEKSLKQQKRIIEEALEDYMQDEDQRDDITIIGLKL